MNRAEADATWNGDTVIHNGVERRVLDKTYKNWCGAQEAYFKLEGIEMPVHHLEVLPWYASIAARM